MRGRWKGCLDEGEMERMCRCGAEKWNGVCVGEEGVTDWKGVCCSWVWELNNPNDEAQ